MATCNNCRMKIPAYSFICPHCRLDPIILGKIPRSRDTSNDHSIGTTILGTILLMLMMTWITGSTWEDWLAGFDHAVKYNTDPAYRESMINDN